MRPRLTELRKEIAGIVRDAEKPINVRTILDRLYSQPNLSTIYRALEFLEKKNYVQSVSLFDGTRLYYGRERHVHFVVCEECREIIEFDVCAAKKIQEMIEEEYKYTVTDHVLYFKGYCRDCRKVREKKALSGA